MSINVIGLVPWLEATISGAKVVLQAIPIGLLMAINFTSVVGKILGMSVEKTPLP
ncbi:MAG: Uncharacterised protein [Polaribacter sp. SA4-10]|nr:MAG: Uncharacterised protein [Polaribacter sp. SA4-10]